jgi:hypothetical protein
MHDDEIFFFGEVFMLMEWNMCDFMNNKIGIKILNLECWDTNDKFNNNFVLSTEAVFQTLLLCRVMGQGGALVPSPFAKKDS